MWIDFYDIRIRSMKNGLGKGLKQVSNSDLGLIRSVGGETPKEKKDALRRLFFPRPGDRNPSNYKNEVEWFGQSVIKERYVIQNEPMFIY